MSEKQLGSAVMMLVVAFAGSASAEQVRGRLSLEDEGTGFALRSDEHPTAAKLKVTPADGALREVLAGAKHKVVWLEGERDVEGFYATAVVGIREIVTGPLVAQDRLRTSEGELVLTSNNRSTANCLEALRALVEVDPTAPVTVYGWRDTEWRVFAPDAFDWGLVDEDGTVQRHQVSQLDRPLADYAEPSPRTFARAVRERMTPYLGDAVAWRYGPGFSDVGEVTWETEDRVVTLSRKPFKPDALGANLDMLLRQGLNPGAGLRYVEVNGSGYVLGITIRSRHGTGVAYDLQELRSMRILLRIVDTPEQLSDERKGWILTANDRRSAGLETARLRAYEPRAATYTVVGSLIHARNAGEACESTRDGLTLLAQVLSSEACETTPPGDYRRPQSSARGLTVVGD